MRARSLLSVAALLTGLAVACGGTTSPATQVVVGDDIAQEAGPDATPGDARGEASPVDASSDGGCISPTVGQPCSTGQTACQPHDPCCAGYEWTCDSTSGTWQQAGLGCACQVMPEAGPFACGNKTCLDGYYCEAQPPGIVAADGGTIPTAYTCVPVPAACASTPTCGCIESTLSSFDTCSTQTPGVTCTMDTSGHVTVHCIGV